MQSLILFFLQFLLYLAHPLLSLTSSFNSFHKGFDLSDLVHNHLKKIFKRIDCINLFEFVHFLFKSVSFSENKLLSIFSKMIEEGSLLILWNGLGHDIIYNMGGRTELVVEILSAL